MGRYAHRGPRSHVRHAERGVGKSPAKAATSCTLPGDGPLVARVWADDGAVSDVEIGEPTRGARRSQLALPLGAGR